MQPPPKLHLPFRKLGIDNVGVAPVFKKLAVGDVFAPRVAEDAFELHLSDGAVQQTAVGDTCLFVSAGAGTTIDVAASALQGPEVKLS